MKFRASLLLISAIFLYIWLRPSTFDAETIFATPTRESVLLVDEGLPLTFPTTQAHTVGEVIATTVPPLHPGDILWPPTETPLQSGMTLTIERAKTFTLTTSEGKKTIQTNLKTVDEALAEQHITLSDHDITLPDENTLLTANISVKIIRVSIEERAVQQPIPFEKMVTEDPKLSWRKNIITQRGVPGTRTLTYRITSHDGKEIQKKLINSEITQEPLTEISTQGTFVQVGKAHSGLGSWYAWTGTLAAASPWLPLGSYAKVTNQSNGKSVIVKINDRGPFGKNRIIDLDKVAFAKIASIGAGIIDVKVEEVTN